MLRCEIAACFTAASVASVRFGAAPEDGCAARFGAGGILGSGGVAAAFFERVFLLHTCN